MDAFPTPGDAGEAVLAGDVSVHDAAVVDAAVLRALARARERNSSEQPPVAGDEGENANMSRGFLLPADSTANDRAPQATAQALGETWGSATGRANANTRSISAVTAGRVGAVPISTLASPTPTQAACREPTPGACEMAWVHDAGAKLHVQRTSYSRPMQTDAPYGARTEPEPPIASATAAATAEIGYFSETSCKRAKSSTEDFQTAQSGFWDPAPREELDPFMQMIGRLYGADASAQVCIPKPELARTSAFRIMTAVAQAHAKADFARFLDMKYSQKV